MDPSILKLLEEDGEDESMQPGEDVSAFMDSLLREIEGKKHSSSQQFTTRNNGIGDANTHILESTQMKEQQRSLLGNQNQELKRENEFHLQHNPPQDNHQNPAHVPQSSNWHSRNNSNEPERLQPQYLKLPKMSSQRAHGVEQPVDLVYHGPKQANICELLHILMALVDKDRKEQLRTLYNQGKRREITKEMFLRHVKGVAGEQMTRLAVSKLPQLQQEPNSTIKMTTIPNFERPTSVNGPSRVQGGPISQNNSSLPLYSAPCQGSVTKDQTVGHVKQKAIDQSFDQARKPCSLVQQDVSNVPMKRNKGNLRRSNDDLEKQSSKMVLSTSTTHASLVSPSITTQRDSSTMVNFPAPSRTIPAGANVRTTPKMPSVGQKKPLEALGSSLPPSSKKQKLCGTSLDRSTEQFNDVTALGGINLMEEEIFLLYSGPKKDGHVSEASRRVVHEEDGRTILQKGPLQRKLAEIMAKSGLKRINDDVERCLSLCVEERMRGLLCNIIRMSKQRSVAEKCRNRTCITSDIRKQINEMNQKAKEEWQRKHGGEEKLKNDENDTAKKETRSEKVKANKEEANKLRAKAANVAAHAAVGGGDAVLKWKLMAEARQKPSTGAGRNSKKPYAEAGGRRVEKNQGLPKMVRSGEGCDCCGGKGASDVQIDALVWLIQ